MNTFLLRKLRQKREQEKLARKHPVYPWKFSLTAHPDSKRQRKAKIVDKAFNQARKMKYGEVLPAEKE